MKLIIDIPENIYEMVMNTGTFGCYRFNTSKAIKDGIPLDSLRTEIINKSNEPSYLHEDEDWSVGLEMALGFIDKYKDEVTHKISKDNLETCPYDEIDIL